MNSDKEVLPSEAQRANRIDLESFTLAEYVNMSAVGHEHRRILQYHYYGLWLWPEFDRMTAEAIRLAKLSMTTEPHTLITVIHNFLQSGPLRQDAIVHFAALSKNPYIPTNIEHVYCLTEDPAVEALFDLYNKLFRLDRGYYPMIAVVGIEQLHQLLLSPN